MNEHDLDRAIDSAAEQMVGREPPPALSAAVMARVRESVPARPRRMMWATAVAGLVLCGVIASVVLNRAPALVVRTSVVHAPVAQVPVPASPAIVNPSATTARETAPALETNAAAIPVTRPAQETRLPLDELRSGIEPIEPLELPSIDLPRLVSGAASVEEIDIEPLTIEPLSASDD